MLKDDGTKQDPVSGNEVPAGSLAHEVRDDVDASLSEGEYVLPADVVRYLGLDKIEKLVTQAKKGLQEMEENGRIGGEDPTEEESEEDDLPFSDEELMVEDDTEVQMAAGGDVTKPQFNPADYGYGDPFSTAGVSTKMYVSADGRKRSIMFVNGVPIQAIPEGFVPDTVESDKAITKAKETQAKETEDKLIEGGRTSGEAEQDAPSIDWSNEAEVGFAAKAAPFAGRALGALTGLGILGEIGAVSGFSQEAMSEGYTAQEVSDMMGKTSKASKAVGKIGSKLGITSDHADFSGMSVDDIADVYGSNVARDVGLARSGTASFSERDVEESVDPNAYSDDYLGDFDINADVEDDSSSGYGGGSSGSSGYGGGSSGSGYGGSRGGDMAKGGLVQKKKRKRPSNKRKKPIKKGLGVKR